MEFFLVLENLLSQNFFVMQKRWIRLIEHKKTPSVINVIWILISFHVLA